VARVRCPFCRENDDKVVDSRVGEDGAAIRRRRECLACGRRFTTYERIDELGVVVRKRDGTREPFDRQKLRNVPLGDPSLTEVLVAVGAASVPGETRSTCSSVSGPAARTSPEGTATGRRAMRPPAPMR